MKTIPIVVELQKEIFTEDKCESCINYGSIDWTSYICVGTYPGDCANYVPEEECSNVYRDC